MSEALSDGKYVYLFFYEPGNGNCEIMEKRLDSFARKTKENVEIIKVDRKDPENREIVNRLRTQTAPIPLILLFDSNNTVLAAFTKAVAEEKLTEAFPSPRKAEALEYIRQGKGVILCFYKEEMSSRGEVQSCCSEAKDKLAGKAEYINVDLSDPKEAGFIKELKIDPNPPEPVTFVVNAQGQVTGKYGGKVEVTNLVQAATRVVKGGCGPSGCVTPCGPTKTKKKQTGKSKP
jgi:thiol-disulfide isomerase/thioredoxin